MKKVLLSLVLATSIMSCDYDLDSADCDCGEVIEVYGYGGTLTGADVNTPCGNRYFSSQDLPYGYIYVGDNVCKEYTYTPSGPTPGAV